MQNAAKILVLGIAIAAFAACHKAQPANQADNRQMSMDENLSGDQLPANADIEHELQDTRAQLRNGRTLLARYNLELARGVLLNADRVTVKARGG